MIDILTAVADQYDAKAAVLGPERQNAIVVFAWDSLPAVCPS
jgi:hypothetical protein